MQHNHLYDVCKCGDYRRDHKDGVGPCRHNKPNDLTHGMQDCSKFRFASPAVIGGNYHRYPVDLSEK